MTKPGRDELEEARIALRQILNARQIGEAKNVAHAFLKDWSATCPVCHAAYEDCPAWRMVEHDEEYRAALLRMRDVEADAKVAAQGRVDALQAALRDVLAVVWSGSSADRKFWRDEAVAAFERAAALAQDDTASVVRNVKENATNG